MYVMRTTFAAATAAIAAYVELSVNSSYDTLYQKATKGDTVENVILGPKERR